MDLCLSRSHGRSYRSGYKIFDLVIGFSLFAALLIESNDPATPARPGVESFIAKHGRSISTTRPSHDTILQLKFTLACVCRLIFIEFCATLYYSAVFLVDNRLTPVAKY